MEIKNMDAETTYVGEIPEIRRSRIRAVCNRIKKSSQARVASFIPVTRHSHTHSFIPTSLARLHVHSSRDFDDFKGLSHFSF